MGHESATDTFPLKTLQAILQGVISFVAIIYAIGFVVANSYYVTFGITDYQLVQARYISTGLLFLFFHGSIAVMVVIFVSAFKRPTILVWLIIIFALWGSFGLALYLAHQSILVMLIMGINAGTVGVFGFQIWALWSKEHRAAFRTWLTSHGLSQQLFVALLGVGSILLISFSAVSWGRSFWPIMSSTLGGGRLNEAIFVFNPESSTKESLPLIPMQADHISEQLPILFEGSDSFVLLVKLDSGYSAAVRLSKSTVISVIYAPIGLAGRKQPLPKLVTPSAPLTPIPLPASTTAAVP